MRALLLGTILFYILLLWFVGWIASRRSKGSEGYLVASRDLSVLFVSSLVAGTWVGGVSVIGIAQGAFLHGLSAIWFQMGIWAAMCFTAAFLPKIITGKKTYSILDVVAHSYDRRTASLAGLFQLFFMIWATTMNIVGGGGILSFLLKGTISFSLGMVLTALVFCLYMVLGGVVATAYTNLIHLITIFLGVMAGGICLWNDLGGLSPVRDSLPAFYFQPFGDLGVWTTLSWFLVNLSLGVLAQPVINAGVSARDLHHGRLGILIGNLLAVPVPCVAALCGIIARYRYPEVASVQSLPILLSDFPPVLSLLFLLGIWAPVMSAGSAFLMGATTIAIRGYFVPFFPGVSDRGILVASRAATVSMTALALLLGFWVTEILRSVTEIAVLLTSITILVLMGGLLIRPSKWGGFLSLLVSLGILVLFMGLGWKSAVHPFWAVLPATPLVIWVFTWIERKREKQAILPGPG